MLQYFNKLQKRRRSEATNLWNEPVDSAHVERDDDHELYMLLQKRAKTHRGSEVKNHFMLSSFVLEYILIFLPRQPKVIHDKKPESKDENLPFVAPFEDN